MQYLNRLLFFTLLTVCILFCFITLNYNDAIMHSMTPTKDIVRNRFESSRNFTYVTASCNGGRLGNQIWPLITGWGISKTLNRKFYVNCPDAFQKGKLQIIKSMFPKLAATFEEFSPKTEVSLSLSPDCCTYDDPRKFENRTEKYIRVEVTFGQNARYFSDYLDELDKLLQFGAEVTDKGEAIIEQRKIEENNDMICAHIRQNDFKGINWTRPIEECLAVIEHIAYMKPNRTMLLFGDDQKFMEDLLSKLVFAGAIAPNSFYSNYTEPEDLYLSNRLCKTFVSTSEASSFGFWLSYLSLYPENVYYIDENRGTGMPQFDNEFPLPWHSVEVVNGTVVIS